MPQVIILADPAIQEWQNHPVSRDLKDLYKCDANR
jgi:hypothetical protein